MRILVIASLALRRLLRDRLGLFFILLLPVIITVLIGVAVFGQSFEKLKVGMLVSGSGPLTATIVDQLSESSSLEVQRFSDRESLETAVRRDAVTAGIIIPSDYDAKVGKGEAVELTFLASPRSGSPQAVRAQIASVLTQQGVLVKAATFASSEGQGSFTQNLERARTLQEEDRSEVTASSETIGVSQEDGAYQGFTYPSASNLVLFVFITSVTASAQLIEARRAGISRRMLSTPTSALAIMLGTTLGRFTIALFQGLFIFAMGSLVFGVDFGDPIGAVALIFLFCLVATGIAMLAGAVLRTPEQAGLGVPFGIGLGMLGGCMWPLEIVGPTMRTIGHGTPHAWAMDGFIALFRGHPASAITTELLVLGGFAIGLISLSVLLFRRRLTA